MQWCTQWLRISLPGGSQRAGSLDTESPRQDGMWSTAFESPFQARAIPAVQSVHSARPGCARNPAAAQPNCADRLAACISEDVCDNLHASIFTEDAVAMGQAFQMQVQIKEVGSKEKILVEIAKKERNGTVNRLHIYTYTVYGGELWAIISLEDVYRDNQ